MKKPYLTVSLILAGAGLLALAATIVFYDELPRRMTQTSLVQRSSTNEPSRVRSYSNTEMMHAIEDDLEDLDTEYDFRSDFSIETLKIPALETSDQ